MSRLTPKQASMIEFANRGLSESEIAEQVVTSIGVIRAQLTRVRCKVEPGAYQPPPLPVEASARRLRIYLAGFDVFLPDAVAHGEPLKALCCAFGFDGQYPLDADVLASRYAQSRHRRPAPRNGPHLRRDPRRESWRRTHHRWPASRNARTEARTARRAADTPTAVRPCSACALPAHLPYSRSGRAAFTRPTHWQSHERHDDHQNRAAGSGGDRFLRPI